MGVYLDDAHIDEILQQAELALKPYVASDGEVVFDVTAHIASGRVDGTTALTER